MALVRPQRQAGPGTRQIRTCDRSRKPPIPCALCGPPQAFPPRRIDPARDQLRQTDYDRATDAHLGPEKPQGATGKSLIFLNSWLSLNQRVQGSSPCAPTKQKFLVSNIFA